MITVKANIRLYNDDGSRKTPFRNGYKPLFNFIAEMKKSGQIILINRQEFAPGEEDIVEILFLNTDYLGDNFSVGAKFSFGEGNNTLGEGEIVEIL